MAGWTVTASGNADDPALHKSLRERLGQFLSDPEYGTGSSSFSSMHETASNFHVPVASPGEDGAQPTPPDAPGAAGGAPATPSSGYGG
jgi:hypothetical protein